MRTFLNGELVPSAWPQCSTTCVVTQKDATVIILRGPLGMSSQSFATDVQWGSEEKHRKGPEGAATVCVLPRQPVFIYCTFRLGSAGRVSPHSFFCISLITNTIEFLFVHLSHWNVSFWKCAPMPLLLGHLAGL